MEMSSAYMQETVTFLGTKGFDVTSATYEPEPGVLVREFVVTRGEDVRLKLEAWIYHDRLHKEVYYLEIERYHQLMSYSFQLDSWKHKPHQIEFKYYVLDATSMGLSFILSL